MGIDVITNGSTRKDFLAFFGKRIDTFVEPTTIRYDQNLGKEHISSELHIEIEAQKLHQVKEALKDAEKLGEEDLLTNETAFAQTNEKISEEISEALPTAVILTLIEDYYQQYSNTLIQIGKDKRKAIRKTAETVLAILVLSFLLLIGNSILAFLSYQFLSILAFILGAICGIIGLVLLKVNLSQRKDLSNTIEKQDLLDRLKATQLLIQQITDEEMKNEAAKNFLASILKQNNHST